MTKKNDQEKAKNWIPAFAGMTNKRNKKSLPRKNTKIKISRKEKQKRQKQKFVSFVFIRAIRVLLFCCFYFY